MYVMELGNVYLPCVGSSVEILQPFGGSRAVPPRDTRYTSCRHAGDWSTEMIALHKRAVSRKANACLYIPESLKDKTNLKFE
jgi:hypothetical protein